MSETTQTIDFQYNSLAALRLAHRELLRKQRQDGDDPGLLGEIAQFVKDGQQTGLLLDNHSERRTAQDLLDYWSNYLSHAGVEHIDLLLANFNIDLAPELADDLCPYVGLNSFQPGDKQMFFGRAEYVEAMLEILANERFLAVLGSSGSGKSSVTMAGLIPELQHGALKRSADWHYLPRVVPGPSPLENLAALFKPEGAPDDWVQTQALRFQEDFDQLLRLANQSEKPVFLLIDQFEELFTLGADEVVQQVYISNLLTLIQSEGYRHTVVVTMRSDMMDPLVRFEALQKYFRKSNVQLGALSARQLREAIERPAELVGLKIQDEVVEALVRELVGEPVGLPLLQFSLLRLWENRVRNRVTMDVYTRIGGGRYALAKAADDLYESLIPEEKDAAERILLKIVRPGEGEEVTRDRVPRHVLYREDPARVDRVLERFVNAHLLRLTPGETKDDDRIEVAHEALVRNWRFLRELLDKEKVRLRERLRLTTAAKHWESLGRDSSATWVGEQLEEVLRQKYDDLDQLESAFLNASKAIERNRQRRRVLIPVAFALLIITALGLLLLQERSRSGELRAAVETAEQLGTNEAIAKDTAEVAAKNAEDARGTAIAERDIAATQKVIADEEKVRAKDEETKAKQAEDRALEQAEKATSRELASGAIASLKSDPQLSLLLAVEAINASHTTEAIDALDRALANSKTRYILSGHVGSVDFLAFNPDYEQLVTAGNDGTLRTWYADNGKEVLPSNPGQREQHSQPITAFAYQLGSMDYATASKDGEVYLWDARDGDYRTNFFAQEDITALALNSSGNMLAIGSGNGAAQLLIAGEDTTSLSDSVRLGLTTFIQLRGHKGRVSAAAFHPNNNWLVTADFLGKIRVWTLPSGNAIITLDAGSSGVNSIAFSPDGSLLATGSLDGSIRLWDMTHLIQIDELRVHNERINDLAFSPDGKSLVSVSDDGKGLLWSMPDGELWASLDGHTSGVNSVSWNLDGTRLVTAGADASVRVWDAETGGSLNELIGHSASVKKALFVNVQGEELVASASSDGTARLWDLSPNDTEFELRGIDQRVTKLAFSSDSNLLASLHENGEVILWRDIPHELGVATEAFQPLSLGAIESPFFVPLFLEFNPDATLLVAPNIVSGLEGKEGSYSEIMLWDVPASIDYESPITHTIRLEANHTVDALAFSLSGQMLVVKSTINPPSGEEDPVGQIQIWSTESLLKADSPEVIAEGEAPSGVALDLSFDPHEDLLVGSFYADYAGENRAIIWDISDVTSTHQVQQLQTPGFGEAIDGFYFGVDFSPDGSRLATSGYGYDEGGFVHLWDVSKSYENVSITPIDSLSEQEDYLFGIDFSPPQGDTLAVGGGSTEIYLWDLTSGSESGQVETKLTVLPGAAGDTYSVAYSPDGKWFAFGGEYDTIRFRANDIDLFIHAACERVTRNMTQNEWSQRMHSVEHYRPTCPGQPADDSAIIALGVEARSLVDEAVAFAHIGEFGEDFDGKIDNAMETLEYALELEPSLVSLDTLRLEFSLDLKDDFIPEKAVAKHLLRTVAGASYVQLLGTMEKALELDPEAVSQVADAYRLASEDMVSRGEFQSALDVIRETKKLDPEMGLEPGQILLQLIRDQVESIVEKGVDEGDHDFIRRLHDEEDLLAEMLENYQELGPEIADLFNDEGGYLIRNDEFEEGLSLIRKAAEINPQAAPQYAEGFATLSSNLVSKGEFEQALIFLQNITEIYPERDVEPADLLHGLIATEIEKHIADGEKVQDSEYIQAALAFDRSLRSAIGVSYLIEEGRVLARQGNTQDALDKIEEALKIEPMIDLDPKEIVATGLSDHGYDQYRAKDYVEAANTYLTTLELFPDIVTGRESTFAERFNNICWFGSLNRQAEQVLPICEEAVRLAPDNANYIDSRGLARGLTGDYTGSIEDFQYYIDNGGSQKLDLRRQIIAALRRGQDPFTDEVLEELR